MAAQQTMVWRDHEHKHSLRVKTVTSDLHPVLVVQALRLNPNVLIAKPAMVLDKRRTHVSGARFSAPFSPTHNVEGTVRAAASLTAQRA